ncbi:spore germination protein [Pelagirhabdus alkalitolerans]|uniref:Spore germination protein n=1 Tax=Pelagirhabdus alkalitolerans TaxID=1612202 RepID=A0A1G6NF94_9BACI|nr:LysM peptidoglycan-binding domain-containing protein [Pelagirhabdus alkalitolerans]SDC66502.1 spore germination protein [Pelagirhabdus alkalitolerans]
MLIYVVKQGDSLYQIANQFNVTVDSIARANDMTESDALIINQALVIPTMNTYTVVAGDSLYKIARQFHTTVEALASINNLNIQTPLEIGQTLTLPEETKDKIEVNAYVEPRGEAVSDQLIQVTEKRAPYLSYLAPFSYEVRRDGTLRKPPLDSLPQIARNNQAALMLTVTNLEDGSFNAELGRLIVTDPTIQETLLNEIIAEAKRIGYRDVHFDLEFLPPEVREDYNQFLVLARDRLHQEGLLISTALAPKTSADMTGPWYEAHDYRAHGEIVDFVVLMTYEWGYSGSEPMAVSPINQVRSVVNYALTEMSPSKILLGQNLYGYDWTLPVEPEVRLARALSPQQATNLARQKQQRIEFDETAQAPYFQYTDEEGNRHEVWFEDARSIQAKFDLIKEKKLRGISYWKLGLNFPQNWELLNDQFQIKKF